jgi:hypothetical protein
VSTHVLKPVEKRISLVLSNGDPSVFESQSAWDVALYGELGKLDRSSRNVK